METLPDQFWTIIKRWERIRLGLRLPLETIDHKLTEVFGKVKKDELNAAKFEKKIFGF